MNLPNFLVIGAQKCGTTWMHELFTQHPDVYVPKRKELEFFSYANKPKRIGLAGYAEHFEDVTTETAIGEKTPSYLWNTTEYPQWDNKPKGFQRDIPGKVHELLGPDIKLIVCLRNPTRRAISGYLHHIKWGTANRNDSILEAGKFNGIIHLGFYYEHLKKWLEVFPREQMLILLFEEVMDDKDEGCSQLFEFIGVDPTFRPKSINEVVYKGIRRLEKEGHVYLLKEGEDIDENAPDDLNYEVVITADEISEIKSYYEKDIDNMEKFLGRSLGAWK